MADIRPEDFGGVPIASGGASPEDFGAIPARGLGSEDTSSREAFRKSGLPPEREKPVDIKIVPDVYPGASAINKPASALAGAAKKGWELLNTDINLPFLGRGSVMHTLSGLGPTEAVAGGAAPKAIVSVAKRAKQSAPAEAQASRYGAGAETVADEAQKAREIIEAGAAPSPGMARSEVERVAMGVTESNQRFKQMLEGSQDVVPVDKAIAAVDNLLSTRAVDPMVRGQLETVKQTIEQALKNAGGNVETIQTAGGPMMVQGGKLVPATQPTGLPLTLADEVRQSINRQIHARDVSGKPLDSLTQKMLGDVRDAIVDAAPPGYRKAIGEVAQAHGAMDVYNPKQHVIGKLSSVEEGYPGLKGPDAQKRMGNLLHGDHADAYLKQLVDFTQGNPAASKGLREAYADWLIQKNALGDIDTGALLTRWRDSRDSVSRSGLMDQQHFAQFDKLMGDLRGAAGGAGRLKQVGNALGWFGANFKGAYVGRHIGGAVAKNVEAKIKQRLVELAAGDAEIAAALNAPQTPANADRLRVMLPTDIAALVSVGAGRMPNVTDFQQQDILRPPSPVEELGPRQAQMQGVRG